MRKIFTKMNNKYLHLLNIKLNILIKLIYILMQYEIDIDLKDDNKKTIN